MKAWSAKLVVTASLIGVITGCGGGPPTPATEESGSISATVATATLAEVPRGLEVVGSVAARRRVMPGSEVMGRVDAVFVEAGDRVHRGQPLARLEDAAFRAVIDAASAGLAMAEAQSGNASRHRTRMEELFSRGAVTTKSLEDAAAGAEVAVAAAERATAELAAARDRLAETVVSSPTEAWVAERKIARGDMVGPGEPLFVLDDAQGLQLLVEVPEGVADELVRGAPVRYQVDSAGLTGEATVSRVIPVVDQRSRTARVEIELEDPTGRARPGQFARVWVLGQAEQLLEVPLSAIAARGQLDALFVVDDEGRARRRLVRLGRRRAGQVEVLAGLEDGEAYLAAPPPGLRDGVTIESGSRR